MSEYDEGTGDRTRGIGKWIMVAGCAVLVAFCLMLGNCSTGSRTEAHDGVRQGSAADGQSGRVADDVPEPEERQEPEGRKTASAA